MRFHAYVSAVAGGEASAAMAQGWREKGEKNFFF
jgi:hypothetical protein